MPDVRDPDGTTYVSAADAEAHVRATLNRPDQVHVIAPETLRALLDEIRGLRLSRVAGCPVGECGHPAASHEPDEYGPDGTPVRPICCAETGGTPCPCGGQWRNT